MRRQKLQFGVMSDRGQQRSQNEDAYALALERRAKSTSERGYVVALAKAEALKGLLFLVADGVGGSEGGEAASLAAVRAVITAYYADTGERRDLALERAVNRANIELHAASVTTGISGSTTLVGLLLLQKHGFVLNVGDSRAYRMRQGRIEQLTQDHSLRQDLLHTGEVAPEDGFTVPENIITRSVGRDPEVTPDIFELELEPGDQILLCTDGLTRHVTDEELLSHSTQAQHPQRAVEDLVALANARGGKDNITALLIRPGRAPRATWLYTLWRILALLILLAGLAWTAWRLLAPPAPEHPQGSQQLWCVPEISSTGGTYFHERA